MQAPSDDMHSQSFEDTPESEPAFFPRYTDEELLSMYEDLLEIPLAQQPVEVAKRSAEDRDTQAMIEVRERVRVHERLLNFKKMESSTLQTL